MTSELSQKHCVPCRGGVPPLSETETASLLEQLGGDWNLAENHHLEKVYTFPDFRSALDFTVRVGAVAEAEGHHPDVHLSWGRVRLEIWTHKINGLTESDFILAAKADEAYR
jgi:4a-hydroxytetrahydrobiopterin dehydratase